MWVSLTKSSAVTTTDTRKHRWTVTSTQWNPHYASNARRGEPGSVSQSRMRVPDPLSDVQSLQNYFPMRGLTTTRPGCLAFSPVYPRGPERHVTFSFGSSANDLTQI